MRVLVALDGSERGDLAVHSLAGWLRPGASTIELLTVIAPGGAPGGPGRDEALRLLRVDAERYLHEVGAGPLSGFASQATVELGPDIAAAIIGRATQTAADVIVVASRGRGGIGRALVGSVAEELVRTSPVPIIVSGPNVGHALVADVEIRHLAERDRVDDRGEAPAAPPEGEIADALERLHSSDWSQRQQGRDALIAHGRDVATFVIPALREAQPATRLAAAQALEGLQSREAIPALIEALEDEDGSVRWAAAGALIACGDHAVLPLLRALLVRSDAAWLQEGAHHVLMRTVNPATSPVIEALEGRYPAITVPPAASEALKAIEASGRG